MKAGEIASNTKTDHNGPTFAKVLDGRKQPIRGLWKRGERYYARLNVENAITGVKKTRRVPLVDKDGAPVQTVPQAIAELRRLQTQRSDNALPTMHRTPKFSDYAKEYLKTVSAGQGAKKASTIEKEKAILGRWSDRIGELRLDKIKRVHADRFKDNRLAEGVAPRTVNLDIIVFRSVMKKALGANLIQRLPTDGMKPLKGATEKRPLFTTLQLETICKAAFQIKEGKGGAVAPITENARQFVDYIRLMSYCGARRNEALGIQWADVDFDNALLHIRRQVKPQRRTAGKDESPVCIETLKNSEERVVDFNPKLRAHLEEMKTRRAPDCQWLFPSPQRGQKDIPAKSFRESLEMVRTKAEMPTFNFHDCRHHFISMCVMSGIDFMTIAAWVGHRDGGILIGKVYGHLANEHRKNMAEKVNFGPAILPVSDAVNL